MLKRYHPDHFHIIPHDETQVQTDMTYEVLSVEILDWIDKLLRNKKIQVVKV